MQARNERGWFKAIPTPYVDTRIVAILAIQERSQAWLARKAGVSVSHMNRVVKGHLPITWEFVRAVCAALQLPPDVVFVRADMHARMDGMLAREDEHAIPA